MFKKNIRKLREWIEESENIVFFGGAGVSTESGIPDFRGEHGLYRKKRKIPLETVLSHDFFVSHPEEFYRHFREEGLATRAEPNPAHLKLAELEREGKLKAIITQNADGLHQMAGSETVYGLHGNANRFYCMNCGKEYPNEKVLSSSGVPHCDCGGLVRPGAVLFGEPLNPEVFENSIRAIEEADMLIVGGTSLVVYPAAGVFINVIKHDKRTY